MTGGWRSGTEKYEGSVMFLIGIMCTDQMCTMESGMCTEKAIRVSLDFKFTLIYID